MFQVTIPLAIISYSHYKKRVYVNSLYIKYWARTPGNQRKYRSASEFKSYPSRNLSFAPPSPLLGPSIYPLHPPKYYLSSR